MGGRRLHGQNVSCVLPQIQESAARGQTQDIRHILDFLVFVHLSGYVALDFYDSNILYDFKNEKTTVCDIDLFRKNPCMNDMGRMWGSSRFMSPEEFELGAEIDEITNVYTAGAFAFALFDDRDRTYEKWTLSEALFRIATKATADDRSTRQQFIRQLREEWTAASAGQIFCSCSEPGKLNWKCVMNACIQEHIFRTIYNILNVHLDA